MKPPNVSADMLDVPLHGLPSLPRHLVGSLEHAGFFTVRDCMDRWAVLATCAGPAKDRCRAAPPNFGPTYLRRLSSAFAHYSRCGVPESDRRGDEPTPEEISERCAEIRAGWDDVRWSERASGVNPIPLISVPMELRHYV